MRGKGLIAWRTCSRRSGQPIGPLYGVPVAIKDIFDTADMPTEYGSPIYTGRTPSRDATVVPPPRAARIIGKTVTTEFAYFSPGKTRNPHNPQHTPAAPRTLRRPLSSARIWCRSRSAARPTARPSACGILPRRRSSHQRMDSFRMPLRLRAVAHTRSRRAVRASNRRYCAARRAVDRLRRKRPYTRPRARIPFVNVAREEPPLPPMFAFIKTPIWEFADDDTKEGFAQFYRASRRPKREEVEFFPSVS